MAKQEMKYEEAVAQLEAIVRRMETGELDLDSQTEELKKAQKLIKMCKDKLTKTDEDINVSLEQSYKQDMGTHVGCRFGNSRVYLRRCLRDTL